MKPINRALLCIALCVAACDESSSGLDDVIGAEAPGLRFGLTAAQARERVPGLRHVEYWGYLTEADAQGYYGFKTESAYGRIPRNGDRVGTIHIFRNQLVHGDSLRSRVHRSLGREPRVGCGGRDRVIDVFYWNLDGPTVVLTSNPKPAAGAAPVHLVLAPSRMHLASTVTNFRPGPC